MKTTERLLAAAKDIWAAYNEHPFVLGIQDGTLAREKFKYYIIQDYLYLEEYAKVFAIGIAKAKRLDTMRLFSRQVNFLTEGEMDIHRGYMGAFTVSQEELAATPRALDNLSYTSYMLRVAYEEGEAEILARPSSKIIPVRRSIPSTGIGSRAMPDPSSVMGMLCCWIRSTI